MTPGTEMTAPLPALVALRDAVQECQGPLEAKDFDRRIEIGRLARAAFSDVAFVSLLIRALNGSIDAAERLRMARLPDAILFLEQSRNDWTVWVYLDDPTSRPGWRKSLAVETHPVESIARTLAVLNALIHAKLEQG